MLRPNAFTAAFSALVMIAALVLLVDGVMVLLTLLGGWLR